MSQSSDRILNTSSRRKSMRQQAGVQCRMGWSLAGNCPRMIKAPRSLQLRASSNTLLPLPPRAAKASTRPAAQSIPTWARAVQSRRQGSQQLVGWQLLAEAAVVPSANGTGGGSIRATAAELEDQPRLHAAPSAAAALLTSCQRCRTAWAHRSPARASTRPPKACWVAAERLPRRACQIRPGPHPAARPMAWCMVRQSPPGPAPPQPAAVWPALPTALSGPSRPCGLLRPRRCEGWTGPPWTAAAMRRRRVGRAGGQCMRS